MPTTTMNATRQQPDPTRGLRRRVRVLTIAVLLVPALLMSAPAVAGKLVGTKGLRNGAVTSAKLHAKAVTASKIRPGSVTGTSLANGTVGLADLSPAVQSFRSGWVHAGPTTETTLDGSTMNVAEVGEARITQAVMDGGQVQVYFKFGADVHPLPYTSNAGGEPSTIGYLLRPGKIVITRFSDDDTPVNLPGTLSYRYEITPPTAAIAIPGPSARKAVPHADSTR